MRAATTGVILVVTLAVAGCGGPGAAQQRRAAVNAYFDQIDHAEGALLGSEGQIDQTFHQYSLARISRSELRQLAYAQTRIGVTLRALRAIKPPPDAHQINADILRLTTLQYRVAHELYWTTHYLPRSALALAPLPAAGRELAHGIATATAPASKPSPTIASSPGAHVWAQAGCASCHALAAAGAHGSIGPDLDLLHPGAAQVTAQVRAGGPGMPSFAGRLSASQIAALAAFVSASEAAPVTTSAALAAFSTAFNRYGTALHAVLAALDRLDAPPVLRPGWRAERQLLARSISLCGAIVARLAKQQIAPANADIRQLFLTVANSTNAVENAKAAAAAVREYNSQLARISALSQRIERERVALGVKLST